MVMTEIIIPVVVAILTGIAGAVIKYYHKKFERQQIAAEQDAANKIAEEKAKIKQQKEEYERLLKEEQMRNYRNMIVEEINPLATELARIKATIKEDEKEFEKRFEGMVDFHNTDKNEVDGKILDLAEKHEKNLAAIRESYKFRFIQLCKTHLRDGYITSSEWEQIVAFYDLYRSLGGNGQAEDYYNKVKALDVVPDKD